MATLTKQQQLYDSLRERIGNGIYGPGFRLVIDQIASEFHVSALPVREAIRRLEAEGLVVYRANAGAQVAPAEPEAYAENLTILAVLEGYATALAVPYLRPEDMLQLETLNDQMVAAMEAMDPVTFGLRNRQFHAVFYSRCPNRSLVTKLQDVGRRLDTIRNTVFVQIPYRGASSVEEHRNLINVIRDGAPPEAIEREARAHKLRTVDSFRDWQRRSTPA